MNGNVEYISYNEKYGIARNKSGSGNLSEPWLTRFWVNIRTRWSRAGICVRMFTQFTRILQREVTFELAGWLVAGKMISEDEGYLRFYDSLPGQRCSQLLLQAFQIDVILVVQLQMDICSARRLVDLELFNSRLPGFHAS